MLSIQIDAWNLKFNITNLTKFQVLDAVRSLGPKGVVASETIIVCI